MGRHLETNFHSDQLQQLSGIQDIFKWTNVRRGEWDAHVNRMEGQSSGRDRQR